jgi:hypothetical protein
MECSLHASVFTTDVGNGKLSARTVGGHPCKLRRFPSSHGITVPYRLANLAQSRPARSRSDDSIRKRRNQPAKPRSHEPTVFRRLGGLTLPDVARAICSLPAASAFVKRGKPRRERRGFPSSEQRRGTNSIGHAGSAINVENSFLCWGSSLVSSSCVHVQAFAMRSWSKCGRLAWKHLRKTR